MGGAIAQELVLARPDLARSLVLVDSWAGDDRYLTAVFESFIWMAEVADSEVGFFNALLPWVYAPALYDDGRIDDIVAAMLANPTRRTWSPSSAQRARASGTTRATA
jgi:pimeloyl-ACP methyl ester carboxylesterase